MADVIDLGAERERRRPRPDHVVGLVLTGDELRRQHRLWLLRERVRRLVQEVQLLKRNAGLPDVPLVAGPIPDPWPEPDVPELPP